MIVECGVCAAHCDRPDKQNLECAVPERLYDGIVLTKPVVFQDGAWLLPTSVCHRGHVGLSAPVKPDRPRNRAFMDLDPWRMTNFPVATDQTTWQRANPSPTAAACRGP